MCGILFANVATIVGVDVPWADRRPPVSYTVEQLIIQQRFFPIFSLLFGVGFGMLWASASRRAAHPRVVLLRRLLALGVFGVLHQILQPGEALLPYAILGIVILLPATWLPARWRPLIALIAGAVLTILAAPAGGMALIPGLFLLGFAAALTGVPERVEKSARPGLWLAAIAGILAVPFVVLQVQHPVTAGFDSFSSLAGLFSGMCLVGIVSALLHTSARRPIEAFFAPLGRMALTNYVGATVVGVLVSFPLYAPLIRLRRITPIHVSNAEMFAIWGCCIALLVVQSIFSRAWLKKRRQGPLEQIWRWATWRGARPASADTETV